MSYEFVPWEQNGPLPTVEGAVEVGDKTEVSVTATGYDERPGRSAGMNGCGEDGGGGCEAANSRDGIASEVESRWSCAPSLVEGGGPCQIEYTFAEPQDIVGIQVAFWKGDERTRTLDVSKRSLTSLPSPRTKNTHCFAVSRIVVRGTEGLNRLREALELLESNANTVRERWRTKRPVAWH